MYKGIDRLGGGIGWRIGLYRDLHSELWVVLSLHVHVHVHLFVPL